MLKANASAYILEPSRKRNIIKENIYDEGAFLMLLLNAECNFSKKKFLQELFPINLPKLTTNEIL